MTLLYTNCPDLELVTRGKARDIYRVDESSLLLVTTDRLSAFDVIMKNVRIFFSNKWAVDIRS